VTEHLFRELQRVNERPAVFSQTTVVDLWTDPHVSEQMLGFHLDGSIDVASHRTERIEAATAWMIDELRLGPGSRVCDLGCGPGLYTRRLARAGASVTGVDFSARSIAYARETTAKEGLEIDYVEGDYLAWKPGGRLDLVTMIMRDYCALAPAQRLSLLRKVASWLEPDGAFLFDVNSMRFLEGMEETSSYSWSPEGGFWSPDAHFELFNRFLYPEEAVGLNKHVIVEAERTRTIFDWFQCFSPESLGAELGEAGLKVASILGDMTGRAFDPEGEEFAVVARSNRVDS
jgi:SAM-dependent methyltransferase